MDGSLSVGSLTPAIGSPGMGGTLLACGPQLVDNGCKSTAVSLFSVRVSVILTADSDLLLIILRLVLDLRWVEACCLYLTGEDLLV